LLAVLHFSPDSAAAHALLAEVYRAEGQPNRQLQELQEALRHNPGLLDARLKLATGLMSMKQAAAALGVIDAAPESQKKQVAWVLGRNWALLSSGNLQEARAGVTKVLQMGRTPEAVFQEAELRFLEHDYAGAKNSVDELLKRDLTDANVLQLMMKTYIARRELSAGMDRLRSIASAKPGSALLQQQLGEWLRRTGDSAGARKAFENAKAADPKYIPADLTLAQMDIEEGHYGASRDRVQAVIAADPKNIPALFLEAGASEGAGDHEASIAAYRAVRNLDRSNVIAMNNLAYQLAAGSPDEALALAQKAAELAPDNPSIQDTLGWIYYRKGLYSMAVSVLRKAIDKESNPRRQYHFGMSLVKSGDVRAGEKIVAEAVLKDPNLVKTEGIW
jgi:tetratricopeptide (TPR) repeat protein